MPHAAHRRARPGTERSYPHGVSTHEHTATTIPTAAGEMPAQVWTPAGGVGPGILVLQEIFGVSSYIRRRAAARYTGVHT